jgi:hypothetical protein
MSKTKSPSSKSAFKPEKAIEASQKLLHPLQDPPFSMDSLSMIIVMSGTFAMSRGQPLILWIGWFVLLSLTITRSYSAPGINQSFISFIISTISLAIMYYTIYTGSIPQFKK